MGKVPRRHKMDVLACKKGYGPAFYAVKLMYRKGKEVYAPRIAS